MDDASDFGLRRGQAGSALERRPAEFVAVVWTHHRLHRRDLPWRRTRDPYAILVSEVMLQQTQVARVIPKYEAFLGRFPSVDSLAEASIADVLDAWSGLGYNRRALTLHRAAGIIAGDHRGRVPESAEALRRLPGIGHATAAAICVFAFAQPHVFVETNIRSAFIHFFFPGGDPVADADLIPFVQLTLDRNDPREWYYALMDYGVWVKRTYGNPSRRSRHYAVQAPFPGSRRELRAAVLRCLLDIAPGAADEARVHSLLPELGHSVVQLESVLEDLVAEGFLVEENGRYRIA